MIVECTRCEAKVDAKILYDGLTEHYEGEPPFKISLLQCTSCKKGILVGQENYAGILSEGKEYYFDEPVRLYPEPHKGINWDLPDSVRNSLDEAEKCYKGKAYSACAVMCGRVLEGICAEYKTKAKKLGRGLKELLEKGIIDQKIFEWGEALKEYRNIGAHHTPEKISKDDAKDQDPLGIRQGAPTEKVSKDDAKDLLDFAVAICDYVFVLTKKFEDFKKRKKTLKGRGKVKKAE